MSVFCSDGFQFWDVSPESINQFSLSRPFTLDIKCNGTKQGAKKRGIKVKQNKIIILKIYRILQLPDRSSGLGAGLPGAAAGPGLWSAAGLPAALGPAAGAGARPGARAPRLGPGPGAGTARPGPGPRPREGVKKCITTATSYQSYN